LAAFALLGVLAGLGAGASFHDYGTLTWDSDTTKGLNGASDWGNDNSSLSWDVMWDANDARWVYEYTLGVSGAPGISHFILNVSDGLPNNGYQSDPFEFTPEMDDLDGTFDYQWYSSTTQGGSNPLMPAGFFGIKGDVNDQNGDVSQLTMTIVTTRQPMWGHFYAKGGQVAGGKGNGNGNGGNGNGGPKLGAIWNAGLEDDTILQDDLEDYLNHDYSASHLLVPNSQDAPPPDDDDLPPSAVPEPLTALALLGSLGGLSGYLRKRRNA
jgi:hypothetical protein